MQVSEINIYKYTQQQIQAKLWVKLEGVVDGHGENV